MVDAGGKHIYGFRMRSNDGHYHVLNVERKGDTMIVTQDSEVIRVALPGERDKSVRGRLLPTLFSTGFKT